MVYVRPEVPSEVSPKSVIFHATDWPDRRTTVSIESKGAGPFFRFQVTMKFTFGVNETKAASDLSHNAQERKASEIIFMNVGVKEFVHTVYRFQATLDIIIQVQVTDLHIEEVTVFV